MGHERASRARGIARAAVVAAVVLGIGRTGRADERVYALVAVDTDTGLAGIERDGSAIRAALRVGFPDPGRCEVTPLQGAAVDPRRILGYFRDLRRRGVDDTDTVLFYYTGHGATVEGRGHCLTTSHGPLFRNDLRAAMEAVGARLVVILTDCCSTVITLPPELGAPAPGLGAGAPPPESPLLKCLLLRHRGVVDLTSSSYGETSWCSTEDGGFFTKALASGLMVRDLVPFDADGDGFVEWREFFPVARQGTMQTYRGFRAKCLADPATFGARTIAALNRQADQVPQAFSLGERAVGRADREYEAPNLAIRFRAVPLGGALGARLTGPPAAGSALAGLRLEAGDTIVALDGLPIREVVDVLYHLGQTRIDFIDVRTGLKKSAVVMLPVSMPYPSWAPREQFAPNLGISYHLIPHGEALGARLSRMPNPGSAAAGLQLEIGDMIVALDGAPIRGPADVANHSARTTLEFVNIRSGLKQAAAVTLPGGSPASSP